MKNLIPALALMLMFLALAGGSLAASVPGSLPGLRGNTADVYTLNALHLPQGYLILDDHVFLYTSSTHVLRANGTAGALTELRKGMRVIIRSLPPAQKNGKQTLTLIQILP